MKTSIGMPATSAAICAQSLSRRFGSLIAVDRITFAVEEGELFGLIGSDGSGKTTTIRLLASIMEPTSGDAWVLGHHVVRESDAIRQQIGYMGQTVGLYDDLTVLENAEFYADIYGVCRSSRSKQIDRLLEFARLTPFKKRLAGHLSGGMKQKLGLVCALVHDPRVLLLDEPTNGLDPVSRHEFWGLLQPLLARGVTILMSTAYMDEAERFGRLALMHNGRIVTIGAPSAVKDFVRGAIVEIQSSESRHVAVVVQELVPGCRARLVGENVRVWMPMGVELRNRIERALADAGVSFGSISEVEPSVEDVFAAMLGEGRREEQQKPADEADPRSR